MWQRFTERARKAVFYAQEEAQNFGEGYVSTEHLLLGLVREEDNTACRILEAFQVSPARLREEVEKQLPRGSGRPSQDMTLTPRAKRVIDLAYDAARDLNNNFIGTEHLLLGLIREGEGLGGKVLAKLGLEWGAVKAVVKHHQEPRPDEPSQAPSEAFPGDQSHAFYIRMRSLLSGLPFRIPEVLASRVVLTRQGRGVPEIVALLVLGKPDPAIKAALEKLNVDPLYLLMCIEAALMRMAHDRPPDTPQRGFMELIRAAEAEAGGGELQPKHLLLAVCAEQDNELAEALAPLGIGIEKVREAFRAAEP